MRKLISITILILLLMGCSDDQSAPSAATPPITSIITSESTLAQTQPPTSVYTSTPQPPPRPASYGPDSLPPGYNPLTGQPMIDPLLSTIPAVLVSISHFPPVARPQAGFSFAPFVYEYFITEGATRHLAVFYGQFPEPEVPVPGNCSIRDEPFTGTGIVIGNRVWFDANQNGIQDPVEGGVGGFCVNLLDANNTLLQQTTTDSNGYYGFQVERGEYVIEFKKPSWLEFAQRNVGEEDQDSDVDQVTGRSDALDVTSTLLYLDAGLIPDPGQVAPPELSSGLPAAEVGPVRSGRLVYRHIGAFYQNSCLIFASADEEVLPQLPPCATVAHTDIGGGAMLSIARMKRIAEQNSQNQRSFNYTGNAFSDVPPPGGEPALELHEYWAYLNQSRWVYDSASGAWWRYVDESNPASAGVLRPEVDRLTGRQLMFENVIVLFAPHIVQTPTIVDIDLKAGDVGKAYLFRDGQVYKIRWSTMAGEYEQKTGLRRPMHFVNLDGTPAALKPGHTWVIILSTPSYLQDLSSGKWQARFVAPEGAK
ncbi:MAG TPA: SdrD B-like domain-containing protein [Anaerolineales bacterium]|nr:SdrD B-like domain-containing protein [Anaerolineales bacterium]